MRYSFTPQRHIATPILFEQCRTQKKRRHPNNLDDTAAFVLVCHRGLLQRLEDCGHTTIAQQHQAVALNRVAVCGGDCLQELVLALLVVAHSLGRAHCADGDFAILLAERAEVAVAVALAVDTTVLDNQGVTLGVVGDCGATLVVVDGNSLPSSTLKRSVV